MHTKEQSEAAADALLQEERSEQLATTARIARRRQSLAGQKWIAIGALLGVTAGGIVGFYFFDQTFPSTLVGLAIGAMLGKVRDGRKA